MSAKFKLQYPESQIFTLTLDMRLSDFIQLKEALDKVSVNESVPLVRLRQEIVDLTAKAKHEWEAEETDKP